MCDHGTGEMAVLNFRQGHVNYKFLRENLTLHWG